MSERTFSLKQGNNWQLNRSIKKIYMEEPENCFIWSCIRSWSKWDRFVTKKVVAVCIIVANNLQSNSEGKG